MLIGENPLGCEYNAPPESLILCSDSFGAHANTGFAMCHEETCKVLGGPVCEVWETSATAGSERLMVEQSCEEDSDCALFTRFNPCGCTEAGSIWLPEHRAVVWTEELMAHVWAAAATICGVQDSCDCPAVPGGVRCNEERLCEAVP